MGARVTPILLAVALVAGPAALAGGPDWFTRVREGGLRAACEEEVARHAKGVLDDSLHVGECYYHLERWQEGIEVFLRLVRSPDRNYAAAATARAGEGYFRLGNTAEARATFERCLEEHPEAWLDESIPDRCRAWLAKLAGEIEVPESPPPPDIEALKQEVRELTERLGELKELIRKLSEGR